MSLIFYPYARDFFGIGCELNNVQKVMDGEVLDGSTSPEEDFEVLEDLEDFIDEIDFDDELYGSDSGKSKDKLHLKEEVLKQWIPFEDYFPPDEEFEPSEPREDFVEPLEDNSYVEAERDEQLEGEEKDVSLISVYLLV